ncbi:hypothetical protein JW899_04030 [Candidatus Uhrbacteria bacterium]|nr:hypothetical protein [Candidatus Uhrbacteria bacterium]
MDMFKKYNLTPVRILKIGGLALVGLVVLMVAVKTIGGLTVSQIARQGGGEMAVKSAPSYGEEMAYDSEAAGVGLSVRNVTGNVTVGNGDVMPPIEPSPVPGDDAEEFEVTTYGVQVETGNLDRDCRMVAGLKDRDYVVFENANEYDHGCNYGFKVRRENVAEVLAVIESLKPKDLSENTYTIKRLVDDYTSELDILETKLDTINSTLTDAVASYDDITRVASRLNDAEALARIINSKIAIVERLTNERINVSARMERLARAKAEQMDRLAYTAFRVSIYENKFVDWERIGDSWKVAVQNFLSDINQILQGVSINLVALLLLVVQYAIYLLLLVLAAKYGWKAIRRIWNG